MPNKSAGPPPEETPQAAAAPKAAEPREFTPGELEAARAQLAEQAAAVPGQAPGSPEQLGAQAAADGAAATSVDADALLRQIKQMQARLDALEAEKRAASVPDVVKYATAISDHLQAHAGAQPAHKADYAPALELAGKAAEAAQAAADGNPGAHDTIHKVLADLHDWLTSAPVRRFVDADASYLIQLAAKDLPAALAAVA